MLLTRISARLGRGEFFIRTTLFAPLFFPEFIVMKKAFSESFLRINSKKENGGYPGAKFNVKNFTLRDICAIIKTIKMLQYFCDISMQCTQSARVIERNRYIFFNVRRSLLWD